MSTREEDSKREKTLSCREMVMYGTPVLYRPDKAYVLTYQETKEENKEDMTEKWIKAIFTKPLTTVSYTHLTLPTNSLV